MMTLVIVLLVLNFATLGALGCAIWTIAHDKKILREWEDPVEPPEVFGEVWEDAK